LAVGWLELIVMQKVRNQPEDTATTLALMDFSNLPPSTKYFSSFLFLILLFNFFYRFNFFSYTQLQVDEFARPMEDLETYNSNEQQYNFFFFIFYYYL